MADFDLVMDVSLRGAFNICRAVVPHMQASHAGTIVCMGSIAAQRGGGVLGGSHYAEARELAPKNIRVNAILLALSIPNC